MISKNDFLFLKDIARGLNTKLSLSLSLSLFLYLFPKRSDFFSFLDLKLSLSYWFLLFSQVIVQREREESTRIRETLKSLMFSREVEKRERHSVSV